MMRKKIAVFGGNGSIAQALIKVLSSQTDTQLVVFSRSSSSRSKLSDHVQWQSIDYSDEQSLAKAADTCIEVSSCWSQVWVCLGCLHTTMYQPEKSMKQLTQAAFEHMFRVNSIYPAMIAKYFLPKMIKGSSEACFVALSARVGSTSDNQLGGWYAYRASKSALNMLIKTLAIESRRMNPNLKVLGLHPGTVASDLSAPYTKSGEKKLFSPDQAASYLIQVVKQSTTKDHGQCLAWDGSVIHP